jgi:uncharacterized membrane protein YozB (DUF420 family)
MELQFIDIGLAAGFLPFRGSWMLDVVFLAMFAIVPTLALSIAMVKRGQYRVHRTIQLVTAAILLVAVIAFEVDMRFFTDWRELAKPSPWFSICHTLLYVHLAFAIPTPILWAMIIWGAMRHFDDTFQAPSYRERHRALGWAGMLAMMGTAVTGIVFYIVAFVL